MNVGVIGGTFDPVHRGHLLAAEEAKKQHRLDTVLFVPAGRPWQKTDRQITPAVHRMEMVRLAIDGKPYFKLSTLEIERVGPSYTIDTIRELGKGKEGKNELFFIMGGDNLAHFPDWRDAARLIRLCYLVVAPRPGSPPPDLEALEAQLPGSTRRVLLLNHLSLDVSSSEVRERVAGGLSIRRMVPEAVSRYIMLHRLYAGGN